MNNLPIEIAEHILSFLPGVQPPNKLFHQANSIPELIFERVKCVKKRYKNVKNACEANDHQATYLLTKYSVLDNATLYNLGYSASENGMFYVCEYLMKYPNGVTCPNDIAYGAASNLHEDIVHLAIDYGATNFEHFLSHVVEKGDLKMFQRILKRCRRRFDYHSMTYHVGVSGNIKMVNYFLSKCPSMNKYSILDGARDNCNHNFVKYLKSKYELNEDYENWTDY